jgi:cell surface protein SprA
MKLARIFKRICYLYMLSSLLAIGRNSIAGNAGINYSPLVQEQDTVTIDTTGSLPFPFDDQPAFGTISQDSLKLFLNKPGNIRYEIEYDPETGQYIFYEKVGTLNYRLPQSMSLENYIDHDFEKSIRDYWRQRSRLHGEDQRRSLIPKLTVGGEAFDRVFGGNVVNIQPQGYVEVSFGYQMNATENPAIPERLRKVPTFDFDEKIQMNVMGQIGTKMNMRVNYNTEATFDYENKMNLEYTGDEDEIIKRIEAGNVSLPLNGTLITGASNLFGVKTEMQFGRLTLTTLFSQHKGETQTVETEGGAQITNFEISAVDYDANRHFFLSQYFRNNYDKWLQNKAVPRSPISINKIEIWVTNKSNNFTESRNILAFQDLGEHDPYIFNEIPAFQENTGLPYPENVFPHNNANRLYEEMINTYQEIRNTQNITTIMEQFSPGFVGGQDFEKIEQARKLSPSEYTVNERLGYISLNTALNSDEVLAVAYSYTSNGKVFQVGEFSTDGIEAPQTLVLKLLKGTNLSPNLPTWDLMMKNIYNLDAYQLTSEEFVLNIVYQNDSTGTFINYLPEGRLNGHILLEVMNLDNLNKQLDPYKDGVFDYIEGITVYPDRGRIIFPVVEPFGKHLADSIQDPALIEKYTFRALYDSTKVIAEQDAEHNKFRLTGSYKGASGSDIMLGSLNLTQGSVNVTAGGRELVENVDYTVDYTLGRVKIINQALLEAGTPIQVSTESEDLFTMQRKTLMGAHANYAFSDNFNLGATALYMHERPLTQKVDYGEDPISNLMLGFDTRWSAQSNLLSKAVDALPFYSTNIPSSIDVEAEIARLIPGHARVIEKSGNAYIDDFEGTKTTMDLKARQAWMLASTPQHQNDIFPEGGLTNRLEYGYNRAKLAWYIIDPLFLRNNSLTPDHIRNDKELQSNHFVREVFEKEIFPAKESPVGQPTNIPVLDLAFYPSEKGPYNYDVSPSGYSAGVNPDGTLKAPETRWGGMMRKIETSDFETSNIEFIEFWMMDPFVYDSTGMNGGGDLYFNLGDISEDVLKDGRKSFENGLPASDVLENIDTTKWGRVSTLQSLVNAFDNDPDSRRYQDIGFDGLNDEDEQLFFEDYLDQLRDAVYDDVYREISSDPSGDNFHYYRGSDYDQQELGILERYKEFNGPDGNSPTTEMSPESYPTSASTIPDIEDINSDNTLNEYERYFQYKVSIRQNDMQMGENYITDVKESNVQLKNGQIGSVKWYQFKIPVRDPDQVFGNINDFKSIRFLRLYLRGFRKPVILRFATMDLVRADWRRYTRDIGEPDAVSPNAGFDVSAVNIEENGSREPVNYILPPGINRVIDPANPQLRQLNEQSMVLKVTNLEQGDARAAYKQLYMDFRRYKRLKVEVHAEEIEEFPLNDDELHFFVRLGSDYNYNYYEYEVPLKLTPPGRYNGEIESDRYIVWPDENRLDVPLEIFTNVKLERNAEVRKAGAVINMKDVYETVHKGWNKDKNRVKIKGSPNLGNVQVVMMGIRHKRGQLNTGPKAVEVWVNEMRLSDFDESGGWAANARVTTRLADLGSVTVAGRTRKEGFGSISQNINSRQLEDLTEVDVSSSIDLGRFFPEKAGVSMPMYYGYSRSVRNPKYNPLEPDIELEKSLDQAESNDIRDSLKYISQDIITRKSLNFTNVRIEPQREQTKVRLWDPENFSLSYSYNEIFKRNINTEYNLDKLYRGMFSYNFSSRSELVRPFKSVSLLNKGPLRLIGDFNFYPLPSQISFRTDLTRRYHEIQTRNLTNPQFLLPATFEKDFLWNRYFDLRYDLTRSLKVDFSSRNTSRIDEPEGRINRHMDDYEIKRDSILTNLWKMGRPTFYDHNINVSYNIPLNRIRFLNFISSTVRYQGSYNWQAGPITADTIRLGNMLQNSSNIQLTGNMNVQSLFNKVPYFNELNQKFRRTGRGRYSMNRRYNRNMGQTEQEQQPQRQTEQTYQGTVKLVAGQPQKITHNLKTKRVSIVVTDGNNEIVRGRSNIVDINIIEFISSADVDTATITVTGRPGDQSFLKDVLDLTTRMLIGVRTISVNYGINGGTVLPGYMPVPRVFGAGTYYPDADMIGRDLGNSFAPGMPFLLGWQNYNFARRAAAKGWLTTDSTLNSPYLFTKNERFSVRATVEPLPDLRIDITAERSFSKNVSEFYNYNPDNEEFTPNSFTETGNFSISTLTWGTAFFAMGKGEVHQSEAFENLKDYRLIIARRLASQRVANSEMGYDPTSINPETGFPDGYGPNSVEVLVPAFLAAYQNKDPRKVPLGLFPSVRFIRPNWRVRYEGMVSRIPGLNNIMRSLNFTHAYRSSYNVGSFITNLNYEEMRDGFSYIRDMANNFITPYDFNSVSIMETFSPLINIDVMWLGDLTTRAEVKRSRNMTLSFANNQLTEILSNEYTIGAGYRFTQMDLIIKTKGSQRSYSNDLNLRADISYRKNKTVLRKIVENDDQITAGQSAFTIRTTADYMLSDRFQLRLFFDKVLNNPFTSLSFPTANTNLGVSFRFTLAQ